MIATVSTESAERVYGPVDYLLTGVYACLAAYATGVSVGSTSAAWMFVAIIAAGTLFSFAVQWLIGEQPVVKYDGLLYLAIGLATFFFREDLAKMVPDQPFADQLLHTGTLCWLLALGSFFTWRDGTLLFQAVPSIALFGMVGAFDTFKAAPFLFFAFLVCLATLFARAHRRQMIEQADASGYKAMLGKEEQSGGAPGLGGARLKAILEGPWKWMAGPEWALASALAIVMISLLGAPALRIALQPIAGQIRVPQPPLTVTAASALLGGGEYTRVQIGQGPQNLGDRPVLIAELDEKRYLRARTYAVYRNRGWESGLARQTPTGASGTLAERSLSVKDASLNEIKHPVRVTFKITILDPAIGSIPVPGEVESRGMRALTGGLGKYAQRTDGTFVLELNPGEPAPPFAGSATVASAGDEGKDAVRDLPTSMQDYADASGVPPDVAALAREVSKNAKTDYEKAWAIKRAIEARCRYNLKAPRTPGGVDPVSNFLFQSREGYCDLFASSMTLMARAAGIPARYSTGFYPIRGMHPPGDNDPRHWQMTESEAHAWSELFFKGVGWVPFDATEGAVEVPGNERGESTITAWYEIGWVNVVLKLATVFVLLAGVVLGYLAYRRGTRERTPTRADLGREYQRFASVLQRASGKRRLPAQTPDEYLKVAGETLGTHVHAATRLNREFVQALYSTAELDREVLSSLRNGTENFRKEISK